MHKQTIDLTPSTNGEPNPAQPSKNLTIFSIDSDPRSNQVVIYRDLRDGLKVGFVSMFNHEFLRNLLNGDGIATELPNSRYNEATALGQNAVFLRDFAPSASAMRSLDWSTRMRRTILKEIAVMQKKAFTHSNHIFAGPQTFACHVEGIFGISEEYEFSKGLTFSVSRESQRSEAALRALMAPHSKIVEPS